MAKHLSQAKGIPYQPYIRLLLHEALEREAKTAPPVA
jgi:predicted DNA binding CopG/RHH family protein